MPSQKDGDTLGVATLSTQLFNGRGEHAVFMMSERAHNSRGCDFTWVVGDGRVEDICDKVDLFKRTRRLCVCSHLTAHHMNALLLAVRCTQYDNRYAASSVEFCTAH